MGQDQVSGGVSVLCWLAAPVAMFYGNLPKFGNKVEIGNNVQLGNKFNVLSDQLRVSLYMVMNKTNHPISSNSNPSATANIAIHCIKRGEGGTKQREHNII